MSVAAACRANLDQLVQTSSAEVARPGYAVSRAFSQLLHFVWRAIGETHLFLLSNWFEPVGPSHFGQLRQTSAAQVAGRGYAISYPLSSTSPLRRRVLATRNTSFCTSGLPEDSVKGEKPTA
jgi:hypothetical protein